MKRIIGLITRRMTRVINVKLLKTKIVQRVAAYGIFIFFQTPTTFRMIIIILSTPCFTFLNRETKNQCFQIKQYCSTNVFSLEKNHLKIDHVTNVLKMYKKYKTPRQSHINFHFRLPNCLRKSNLISNVFTRGEFFFIEKP